MGLSLPVAEQHEGREGRDHHDQQDPAGGEAQVAVDQVVEDVVGDADGAAAVLAAFAVGQEDEHALEAEQAGQGDDERGHPQAGDQAALQRLRWRR